MSNLGVTVATPLALFALKVSCGKRFAVLDFIVEVKNAEMVEWQHVERALGPIGEPTRFSPPPLSMSRAIRWADPFS